MTNFIQSVLSLQAHTDFEKTQATINDGISMRGYKFWILVCSTMLASIGLDTNSTAVIIGAMLISPLMSPILGVGLSLAIHDRQVLTRSIKNLSLAAVISLVVSVIYFYLSPLGDITPELQARTYPTLLDVGIALFGGVAGIVSISREGDTTAIPGVAIATALMPPLCTAGFGLATANWNYFFGAFYLFFINAVFISFATYLVVRYLHFPEKEFVNKKVAKQYRNWFTALSLIALTPSIYLLYTVYQREVIENKIEQLVIAPIEDLGNEILKWEIQEKDSIHYVKVYHSGVQLSDSLKSAIDSSLSDYELAFYRLASMRVNLNKEEVSKLSAEMTRQMFQEMQLAELRLQDTLSRRHTDSLAEAQVLKEVKVVFSFIDTMYNGWMTVPNASRGMDTLPVIYYKTNRRAGTTQTELLYDFLKVRMVKDSIVLINR